jgi:hypothetical protein
MRGQSRTVPSADTSSIPEADPRSGRPGRGGRESDFRVAATFVDAANLAPDPQGGGDKASPGNDRSHGGGRMQGDATRLKSAYDGQLVRGWIGIRRRVARTSPVASICFATSDSNMPTMPHWQTCSTTH